MRKFRILFRLGITPRFFTDFHQILRSLKNVFASTPIVCEINRK